MLRSRPGAAHHGSVLTRAGMGWSGRHIGLLCGILLAVAGPLAAQGLGDDLEILDAPEDAVLDSLAPTAANWVVLEAIGAAAWRAQGERHWRAFTRGEVLPPGCEIETGADGEVMLVAGGDQLTVAPLGRLIVPQAAPGQDRRLRHERGRILVHIESRTDRRDVRVKTPLLSLGIKGTTFEIDVDSEQNSVVVHDGEVEVTPPEGQDPVALGAGEGLRQPTAPGNPATRFTPPPGEAPPATVNDRGLQPPAIPDRALSPPSIPDRAGGQATTDGRESSNPEVRTTTDRPASHGGRASSPTRKSWGWIDDWASSWAWVAIAGVALLFLAIPVLAIVHNLRERGRDRPGPQGRRRRELVRG